MKDDVRPSDVHPMDVPTRREAAAYVAELTADLAVVARRHGLDALGYLLEMAHMEADNATRHMNSRR